MVDGEYRVDVRKQENANDKNINEQKGKIKGTVKFSNSIASALYTLFI